MADRILTVGDDINTDDIIPAKRGTQGDLAHLAHYALEHILGAGVLQQDYDVIEAGHNFGCGSSREYAPLAIKAAGIHTVRAYSFAEIFYRNSINIGLALEIRPVSSETVTQAATQAAPHGSSNGPSHAPRAYPSRGAAPDPVVDAIIAAGGLFPFNQQRRSGNAHIPSSPTPARPMTLAEKLLARASGNDYVQPGEVIFAQLDLAMSHDAIAGPVGQLFHQHFGPEATLWDPKRVVLVADHFIQVNDIRPDPHATQMYDQMVAFAHVQGCQLFDVVSPGEAAGICHVLLPEQGLIRPGMVIAGTDSHSCTYGAFGCFSTGVGTTDMANSFATGDMWLRVPATILIELSGRLPEGVCAKDIMLFILGRLGCGGATGTVLEFRGSIIEQLPMDERMTLANMAIECGAMCGLMPVDDVTLAYGRDHPASSEASSFSPSVNPQDLLQGDDDAVYAQVYQFDLSTLAPQVATPPKPDQVVDLPALPHTPITRAFIGSCTGGKLFDLAEAAAVLKGQQIHPQVSLFVVPASQGVKQQAEALGYLHQLEAAGATVLKSGCGACINSGMGVLGQQEVGIYATNRNFKGRSGDPSAQNYLASPRTVAFSALCGYISDRLPPTNITA